MADRRIFLLFIGGYYNTRPINPLFSAHISPEDPTSGLRVDSGHKWSRSRLPDLDGISFTFPMNRSAQNFYHMDDFMIVSEDFKDALVGRFGDELQVSSVCIQYEDGSLPPRPYFAARVKTVIDCIDPERSTWRANWGETVGRKFADGLSVSLLEEKYRKEFANGGGAKYISYPRFGEAIIGEVRLTTEKIPPNAVLFQPKYWPGHWLIEASFADKLERACSGGTPAYYLWRLSLHDVDASLNKHLFELR